MFFLVKTLFCVQEFVWHFSMIFEIRLLPLDLAWLWPIPLETKGYLIGNLTVQPSPRSFGTVAVLRNSDEKPFAWQFWVQIVILQLAAIRPAGYLSCFSYLN